MSALLEPNEPAESNPLTDEEIDQFVKALGSAPTVPMVHSDRLTLIAPGSVIRADTIDAITRAKNGMTDVLLCGTTLTVAVPFEDFQRVYLEALKEIFPDRSDDQ